MFHKPFFPTFLIDHHPSDFCEPLTSLISPVLHFGRVNISPFFDRLSQ